MVLGANGNAGRKKWTRSADCERWSVSMQSAIQAPAESGCGGCRWAQVAGMGIMTCGKQIAKSGLSGNRNRCGTAKATAGCRSADLEKPPIAISKKRFCAPSIWSVRLGNPKEQNIEKSGRAQTLPFFCPLYIPSSSAGSSESAANCASTRGASGVGACAGLNQTVDRKSVV